MPREYLTTIESARQRAAVRHAADPVQTTEDVADPDADSEAATAQESVAAGALIGTAVAGPLGTAVGGAIAGSVGAVNEATHADEPSRRDQAVKDASSNHRSDDSDMTRDDERHDEKKPKTELDPGAYIGRLPEREAETIPGGVSDADERVAAHDSRPGPSIGQPRPRGHRSGPPANDDDVREAGQDR